MKKIIVLLATVALFRIAATAQTNGFTSSGTMQAIGQTHRWHGYLLDAKTAADIMKDPSTAAQQAENYPKAAALAADPSLGFGIYANGTWLRFDATGNSQVQSLLVNSKNEKGILVQVDGSLNGDIIAVTSVKEVSGRATSPNQ